MCVSVCVSYTVLASSVKTVFKGKKNPETFSLSIKGEHQTEEAEEAHAVSLPPRDQPVLPCVQTRLHR